MEEAYERNGLTVTIEQDMDPESPREWDNVGKMVCSHRNYTLGDEQFDADDYDGWLEVKNHLIEDEGAVVILPLSLYDHSGISMSVGKLSGWDSGQVGFIYCTQEDIDREWEGDAEKADAYLRSEVETYNQYLTGQVYQYSVDNPKNGENIDMLSGLYGYDYTVEEANAVADNFKHPHDAAYAKGASQLHG